MTQQEILYTIATTQINQVGPVNARLLLERLGSFTAVYENRAQIKNLIPEISSRLSYLLNESWSAPLARAERELEFMLKNNITPLCLGDTNYPSRLQECVDAPIILYYKGSAELNARRVISIVGTRHCTEYGKDMCAQFVYEMQQLCPDVLIVSGLAYGIDFNAHSAALTNRIPTVGILAHGLDRIYPTRHRTLAIKMLEQEGGLLTEYLTNTTPDRYNFVSRNRIVAGLADAVVVVESREQGGALITAEIAEGYNRDVFAFAGRVTDHSSAGCLNLIRQNKASLITCAADLIETMNWQANEKKNITTIQRELFPELTSEENLIVKSLRGSDGVQINTLVINTNIPIHKLSALLFEMEMKGVVKILKGGMYKLI